jgi:hypothetical protein
VLNDADIDVNVHHGTATFNPPTSHEKKHAAGTDTGKVKGESVSDSAGQGGNVSRAAT